VELEVELAVLDLYGRERVAQQPLERLAEAQDQAVVAEGELDRTDAAPEDRVGEPPG
jgi:hypothetical protein